MGTNFEKSGFSLRHQSTARLIMMLSMRAGIRRSWIIDQGR